jgi:hypothetical protein
VLGDGIGALPDHTVKPSFSGIDSITGAGGTFRFVIAKIEI